MALAKDSQNKSFKFNFETIFLPEILKYKWTIQPFSLISTSLTHELYTPIFLAGLRNSWDYEVALVAGIRKHRDGGMKYLYFFISQDDGSDVPEDFIWATVRLYDMNNRLVRLSPGWRKSGISFKFPFESDGEVSLNNLPNDCLVIVWEVARIRDQLIDTKLV